MNTSPFLLYPKHKLPPSSTNAISSSERLYTRKLDCINFDVAIFTNLTRDHLDTHKTMENYALAKAISFEQLKKEGLGIVNYDDAYKEYFIDKYCSELGYSFIENLPSQTINLISSKTNTGKSMFFIGNFLTYLINI